MEEQQLKEIANQYTKDKYAMYLRKSRADLELEMMGEGETLARHKLMLDNLAAKMEILPEQIEVYREVVSGESLAERPEAQRLLNNVYQKKYKGVFVVEVERLARGNTKDQGEVADAFQFGDAQIITPSKVYDPHNEFDQEYFEFGLFMSRREYKTIKRRMEAGRMQSVTEGNYVGSMRPYGYDIKRVNKKERILVANEDEAPYVKMIFDWFTIDRHTAGWIARELTDRGVPTLTKKPEWNRGTVIDILKNSHYIGVVRWNRRRNAKEFDVETGTLNRKKRRLSPEDYKEYPGKHKALISREQFELAQSLFTASIPVHLTKEISNPFARLLVCKDCGKPIAHNSYNCKAGTQPRYIHKYSTNCKKKSMPAVDVVRAVIGGLKAVIDDYTIKMTNDHVAREAEQHNILLAGLTKELAKQEEKKRRLFDAYESDDGMYTRGEFIERKKMYTESIDNLKVQIKTLKDNAPIPVDYTEKIVTLHKLIDMLQDDSISAKSKNDFLKTIVKKIEYDVIDYGRLKGGKIDITINLK